MFSDTQQGDLAKTQPPYEKGGSLKGHCRLDVEPAKGAGQKDGGLLQLSLPGGKTTRPPRPLLLSLHGLLSTTLMPLPVGGFWSLWLRLPHVSDSEPSASSRRGNL